MQRVKNELPPSMKDHCMAKKYVYSNFDEQSGFWKPHGGDFIIVRPYATFAMSAYFNSDIDPFEQLEKVTMDEGDILLVAIQKTGTHLLYEITRMLCNGKAEYIAKDKDATWLEVQSYDTIMESVTVPRVLNTHLVLSWLPPNFRRNNTKVIATLRNPKDAFVSWFHHEYNSTEELRCQDKKTAWDVAFKWLLYNKTVGWTSFLDMMADTWDNHRSDPNVLIIHYEQLKLNIEQCVEDIARHMGVVYTQSLIKEIVAACEIDKMRASKVATFSESPFYADDQAYASLYRKGKIGDWKNWFTVAQNEEFNKIFDEWNKERQIPFIFE